MKKVLILMLVSIVTLAFSGCTGMFTKHEYTQKELDKAYEVSKGAYKVGKTVVEVVAPKIGTKTMETLKTIDKVAVGLDGVRAEIKKPVTTPLENID